MKTPRFIQLFLAARALEKACAAHLRKYKPYTQTGLEHRKALDYRQDFMTMAEAFRIAGARDVSDDKITTLIREKLQPALRLSDLERLDLIQAFQEGNGLMADLTKYTRIDPKYMCPKPDDLRMQALDRRPSVHS